MRAELVNVNHWAVPFLSRAADNIIMPTIDYMHNVYKQHEP